MVHLEGRDHFHRLLQLVLFDDIVDLLFDIRERSLSSIFLLFFFVLLGEESFYGRPVGSRGVSLERRGGGHERVFVQLEGGLLLKLCCGDHVELRRISDHHGFSPAEDWGDCVLVGLVAGSSDGSLPFVGVKLQVLVELVHQLLLLGLHLHCLLGSLTHKTALVDHYDFLVSVALLRIFHWLPFPFVRRSQQSVRQQSLVLLVLLLLLESRLLHLLLPASNPNLGGKL